MSRVWKDKLVLSLVWISAGLTVGILAWILIYVIANGAPHINIEFLTAASNGEEGGILPMIVNTLFMIGLSLAIATPISVLAAVYLNEYAQKGKVLKLIRFATESLAGIPSIVFGLFGMIFFVIYLKLGWSIVAGSLTLSIMVLPTIVRTTEEALKAVPMSLREGSLGLGATKLRTVWKAVLPSAVPGILTAIILSVGRVVGETAAVFLTAGMVPRIAETMMQSGRTLAVHMYLLAKEGISFDLAYATATVLIILVSIINFSANYIGKKLNKSKL